MIADVIDLVVELEQLDTGPRSLRCPTCCHETTHHFSDDELCVDGLVRWWRCEVCRTPRSLETVALTPEVR